MALSLSQLREGSFIVDTVVLVETLATIAFCKQRELTVFAIAQAIKNAPKLGKDQSIVICLSGRGDKDMENIRAYKAGKGILQCK